MNYAAIQERLINWPVTEFVIPRFFGRKWHFINLLFQNGLSWGWTSYNKFSICDNLTENLPIWPWFIFPSGLRNQFHQLKWFHTDHLGLLLLVCTDFKSLFKSFQTKITFWSQLKAILLLHGAAFSSETWESVGTLEMLNELGVSTVTIDLPSYHNSAKVTIPKNKIEYLSFIREQFEILNFKKIFIISPSMSGKVC